MYQQRDTLTYSLRSYKCTHWQMKDCREQRLGPNSTRRLLLILNSGEKRGQNEWTTIDQADICQRISQQRTWHLFLRHVVPCYPAWLMKLRCVPMHKRSSGIPRTSLLGSLHSLSESRPSSVCKRARWRERGYNPPCSTAITATGFINGQNLPL